MSMVTIPPSDGDSAGSTVRCWPVGGSRRPEVHRLAELPDTADDGLGRFAHGGIVSGQLLDQLVAHHLAGDEQGPSRPCAVPAPGDYNGDGLSDLAVYDEESGNWYVRTLQNDVLVMGTNWGFSGAAAVPGDYNGDGTSDLAVYDQSRGNWYVRTLQGDVLTMGTNWGYAGTVAVPGDYDADGTADLAVYDELRGNWFIRSFNGPILLWQENWGFWGAVPVPGDYDGDGFADMAVYGVDGQAIPAGFVGNWFIRRLNGDILLLRENWGARGFAPVNGE